MACEPCFSSISKLREVPPGPPPAYDTVVQGPSNAAKDCDDLQEVVAEPCPRCIGPPSQPDGELPSYEAAVLLRDTKL